MPVGWPNLPRQRKRSVARTALRRKQTPSHGGLTRPVKARRPARPLPQAGRQSGPSHPVARTDDRTTLGYRGAQRASGEPAHSLRAPAPESESRAQEMSATGSASEARETARKPGSPRRLKASEGRGSAATESVAAPVRASRRARQPGPASWTERSERPGTVAISEHGHQAERPERAERRSERVSTDAGVDLGEYPRRNPFTCRR